VVETEYPRSVFAYPLVLSHPVQELPVLTLTQVEGSLRSGLLCVSCSFHFLYTPPLLPDPRRPCNLVVLVVITLTEIAYCTCAHRSSFNESKLAFARIVLYSLPSNPWRHDSYNCQSISPPQLLLGRNSIITLLTDSLTLYWLYKL